MLEKWQGI